MRSFQGYNYQKQTDRYKDKQKERKGKRKSIGHKEDEDPKKNEDNYSR